jgi:hypothetical protein
MALQFSPDGSILGCACDDGSVRLWKLAFIHEATGGITGQFGKKTVRPDPAVALGYPPLDPVTMVRGGAARDGVGWGDAELSRMLCLAAGAALGAPVPVCPACSTAAYSTACLPYRCLCGCCGTGM